MLVDYILIGKRIKDYRNKCGFTQAALAEKLDVSVGFISQIERGITKPNLEMLASIASVVDCDIADLVSDAKVTTKNYMMDEFNELYSKLLPSERKLLYNMVEYHLQSSRK
ncbi:MAG: helix-turn-helix transcriptional regulator [Lachnospiraceae bacterium]|jgi:transcriptional regulator with XRE-family HTH domain|nr:helix-turn-helix transcriptional regulator [uncultured Agathobacter sp.]MCI7112748.1 helix-turn-helix domain-containing protein [Lachnobacterium sp.]MDD6137961.1 helix-turn-helix transcriptional regulator [Lachnospiraceae bacterium]